MKKSMVFVMLCFLSAVFFVSRAHADTDTALTEKMDQLSAKQDQILKKLDELKKELEIIKVRTTQ